MISTLVNDAGLALDILGAVLLFRFGLPAAIDRKGRIHRVIEQVDHEEVRKGKLYDCWGKIGLSLLVFGFVLQFASNHLSN